MIKVGYWDKTYAEKRLIINKINKGVDYIPIDRECNDWILKGLKCLEAVGVDAFKNRKNFHYHSIKGPACDLLHCFNGVCDTKLPWFSSYETILPRILGVKMDSIPEKLWVKYNAELLVKDNCKGMFPISQSAYDIQEKYIKRYFGEYYAEIMRKTRVIHPPQEELVTEEEIHNKNTRIHEKVEIIFVGTGFWVKGGKEAVEVLGKYKDKYPIHLTIVSNFMSVPGQEPGYTRDDYRECMKVIQKNKDWITIHSSLPNKQILRLCREKHIALLPSYGDTYGYVCLEFQAAGMPVVTSDIRALPEINNNDCGYIFPIDSRMNGKEKQQNNREQLDKIFEHIFSHPEEVEQKGINSLHRIRKDHSPRMYGEFMLKQYENALH